jgi:hypothetical protein
MPIPSNEPRVNLLRIDGNVDAEYIVGERKGAGRQAVVRQRTCGGYCPCLYSRRFPAKAPTNTMEECALIIQGVVCAVLRFYWGGDVPNMSALVLETAGGLMTRAPTSWFGGEACM